MSSCSASGFLTAADARLKSRNDKVIYGEISAIENQLLDAMCNCDATAPLSLLINGGTPITSPNGISDIIVLDGGLGYTESSPTVVDSSVTGSGLLATALVDLSTGGIIGFSYDNRGNNYVIGDAIIVAHANGATGVNFEGNVASVGNNGEVQGINIIVSGTGYLDTPYVNIVDPSSGGSDFLASVALDINGTITTIDIINSGIGYSANATAVVVGDTSGTVAILSTQAEASKHIDLNLDPTYYYKVWAGLIDNTAVKLQLDTVQKYFTDLGYNFIIQVNPTTMDTLQYQISW
jgi:hypothetical protein